MKIKKGDKVIVRAGKDKGKVSTVSSVLARQGKIVMDGINIAKKHLKPTQENKRGGIIEIAKPIDSSSAMILCPNCNKPTRVEMKISGKTKERICKKCSGSLDKKREENK